MNDASNTNQQKRRMLLMLAVTALYTWLLGKSVNKRKNIVCAAEKKKPIKMLTEDGMLVEVDAEHLTGQRQRLQPEEFHSWVKHKK